MLLSRFNQAPALSKKLFGSLTNPPPQCPPHLSLSRRRKGRGPLAWEQRYGAIVAESRHIQLQEERRVDQHAHNSLCKPFLSLVLFSFSRILGLLQPCASPLVRPAVEIAFPVQREDVVDALKCFWWDDASTKLAERLLETCHFQILAHQSTITHNNTTTTTALPNGTRTLQPTLDEDAPDEEATEGKSVRWVVTIKRKLLKKEKRERQSEMRRSLRAFTCPTHWPPPYHHHHHHSYTELNVYACCGYLSHWLISVLIMIGIRH